MTNTIKELIAANPVYIGVDPAKPNSETCMVAMPHEHYQALQSENERMKAALEECEGELGRLLDNSLPLDYDRMRVRQLLAKLKALKARGE